MNNTPLTKPRLTKRQWQTLEAIAHDLPNKAIAGELGISIKTVEKHRDQLFKRLGVHTAAGAVLQGVRFNLLLTPEILCLNTK